MRIRLSQLRRIIKEEVSRVMNEAPDLERKAFRDLKGSYDFLKNKANVKEEINRYFNEVLAALKLGEPLYGPRDSIEMGSEFLNTQVWLLVNGAVKLGLKSFDEVGKYIDNNPELAEYTKDEIAGHEQADRVYPPLRR